jgi:hypothetical protein
MPGDNSTDDSPAQNQIRSSQRKKDQYLRPTNRSIPDILDNPQNPSNVIDAATARIELTSRGMMIPVSGASIESLIESLLEFTLQAPGLTRLHVDIIRAIAIMLDQADYTAKAQRIAKETTLQMSGMFDRMEKLIDRQEIIISSSNSTSSNMANPKDSSVADQVAAVIIPQMEKVITFTKTLTDTLDQAEENQRSLSREREEKEQDLKTSAERIEEAADAFYHSAEDCQNAMKLLTPSLDSAQNKINSLSVQLQSQPEIHPSMANGTPTFSDAVRSFTPGPADQALARAAIRARQILIDPTPGNRIFPINVTHAEVVDTLRNALKLVKPDDIANADIKAVMQLKNGGIIMELNTEESAKWMRTAEARTKLTTALKTPINFRDQTYALIIQYLSTSLHTDRPQFLRLVEEENSLKINSLASIRWIKAPERRPPGQLTAFAMLQISDPSTANQLLKDGLYINREKLRVRKDRREPIRCAKCQHFGHMAKNCQATQDSCGTCGKEHRTSECTGNSNQDHWCTNCRSNNHASWSRECPTFGKQCQLLDDRYPENTMPYFPTSEPWTQVMLPPKAAPYQRQSTADHSQSRTLRQTTLNSLPRQYPANDHPPPRTSPHQPRPQPINRTQFRPLTQTQHRQTSVDRTRLTTAPSPNRFSSLPIDDTNPPSSPTAETPVTLVLC